MSSMLKSEDGKLIAIEPRMKITGFQIKGYKGIEDLFIDNIGQVNVFIGKNNTGKSSILEALNIGIMSIRNTYPGKINWNEKVKEHLIIIHFTLTFDKMIDHSHQKEYQGDIWRISFTHSSDSSKRGWTGIKTYYKQGSLIGRVHEILRELTSQFRMIKESVRIQERESIENAKESVLHTKLRSYTDIESYIRCFYHYWRRYDPEKFRQAIEELRVLPVTFSKDSVDYTKENEILFMFEEYGNLLEIRNLGMGSKRFLTLIFYTQISTLGITIDEIENSLHPSLIRKLHHFLLEYGDEIQFFIATHSPIFLNHSDLKSVYLTNRDKNGIIECHSLQKNHEFKQALDNIGVLNNDILQPDSFIFIEGKIDLEIFESFAQFLIDSSVDRIVQFIKIHGKDNLNYYIALLSFIRKIVSINDIVYILDGDVGSKEKKIQELLKYQHLSLTEKELETVIHVLSKQSIEGFLLNAKAISSTYGFHLEKVR